MNTSDHGWQRAGAGWRVVARRYRLAPRWRALTAAALGAGLLIAFVQVVLANVQNGKTRNRAVAERADAVWRCNLVRSPSQRANCLAQIDAPPAVASQ